jgi:hypothetical protein
MSQKSSLPQPTQSASRVLTADTYEEGLRRILRLLFETKRSGVFEETFSCLWARQFRLAAAWMATGRRRQHRCKQPVHPCGRPALSGARPSANIERDRVDRHRSAGRSARVPVSTTHCAFRTTRWGSIVSGCDRRRSHRQGHTGESSGGRVDHPLCAYSRPRRTASKVRAHCLGNRPDELFSVGGGVGGRFAHCVSAWLAPSDRSAPIYISHHRPCRVVLLSDGVVAIGYSSVTAVDVYAPRAAE